MMRRDILRRIEKLEALTKAKQPAKAATELHLDGMTPLEVAHLARWAFQGDHSQPLPADIAHMLTLATGEPWQAGEVIA